VFASGAQTKFPPQRTKRGSKVHEEELLSPSDDLSWFVYISGLPKEETTIFLTVAEDEPSHE
jgi:hypothetical protein